VSSAFTNFAGPIHAPVVLAESVVSPVYTPGVGNLV
jgi:hypothetical protein